MTALKLTEAQTKVLVKAARFGTVYANPRTVASLTRLALLQPFSGFRGDQTGRGEITEAGRAWVEANFGEVTSMADLAAQIERRRVTPKSTS